MKKRYAIIINRQGLYMATFYIGKNCKIQHRQIIYAEFDTMDPDLIDYDIRQIKLWDFINENGLQFVDPDQLYNSLVHAENRSRYNNDRNLNLFKLYM